MMMTNTKWNIIDEKLEILRGLTDKGWQKEDWELAALGERTIKTVEESKAVIEVLKAKVEALERQLGKR